MTTPCKPASAPAAPAVGAARETSADVAAVPIPRVPPIPTPGGLGSVEAALIVALVAVGGPVSVATAVVLAYRIITVWVPLVPGALTLGALVRLKVI
jgi:hypothetical protein